MCRNGRYTERGIKELDGYGSQRWTVETEYAVRLDPHLVDVGMLMEPTTVVAKAWEQVRRVGERAYFDPRRALITGAGPIGLLAALLSVQQGLDTHVLDRVTDGPKPGIVKALGATYHHDDIDDVASELNPDVVIEATGAGPVVFGAIAATATYGIVCLTGVSPTGHRLKIDAGAVNRELVLENDAVVGSVNANLRHYHQAVEALAKADKDWLASLDHSAGAAEPGHRSLRTPQRRRQGCHHARRRLTWSAIEDYGLLGDLHTAALVGRDGSHRLAVPAPLRLARLLRRAARWLRRRAVVPGTRRRRVGRPTPLPRRLAGAGDRVGHRRRRGPRHRLHAAARRGRRRRPHRRGRQRSGADDDDAAAALRLRRRRALGAAPRRRAVGHRRPGRRVAAHTGRHTRRNT